MAFSNQSKSSATFANQSQSAPPGIFGNLTYDQIGAITYSGLYQGIPVGNWHYNDSTGTSWGNQAKS